MDCSGPRTRPRPAFFTVNVNGTAAQTLVSALEVLPVQGPRACVLSV